MPRIYDNIEHHLSKGLTETLNLSKRCDFCVGYFNLRGWHEIADKIDSLDGMLVTESEDQTHRVCRLLVGMQKLPAEILKESFLHDDSYLIDQAEMLKLKKRLAAEFKEQLTIGTPSERDEIYLRKLSRQLKENRVVVKLHLKHPLHAKLYLAYSDDVRIPVVGFLGSSNLTLAGLSKQGELNIDVMDHDAALKLSKWFDDRWNDNKCIDITKELIQIIDESWAADRLVMPYHIYLKIAYHLSREARAGISEFKLPKIFQQELLDFQQKAVLIAAHHLHKRGGVMIGDVVGLGKTITATALAKMFEEDFFLETLIICPKNIVEMWEDYVYKYQLHAKVLSQSMVQKQLPNLRRYRIVVIDESHNMRNDNGSRYRAIKAYIEENESKVILLSATPYNKSYIDLSNQLRLFLADDKDLGISPERYIESTGGPVHFAARHTETFIRSIKAFEKSTFSDDWRELMRLYLVRRTRSFIKNNYAVTDKENGRKYLTFSDGSRSYFPDRLPKKVEYAFDPENKKDQYAKLYSDQIIVTINGLELARYGLGNYINEKSPVKRSKDEEVIIANLSRAGKRLMGFCRTNLFKRLESSGYSFLLSLSRHILRNFIFVYALENNLPLPIGKNIIENMDDYLEDSDLDSNGDDGIITFMLDEEEYLKRANQVYELYTGKFKTRFEWIRSELFVPDLKRSLIHDGREIIKILSLAHDWNPEEDRQLKALHELINKSHKQDKILIFTQFADTANYLFEQLKAKGVKSIECVTGDSENPTHYAHRFSPFSNEKQHIKGTEHELRVLITTDVLSEGQNLQDAHIILNYDLPWAIIRLIQRAGRVDRIGQKSDKILCYSFLPEDGIENIIRLRGRLRERIKQNAEVVGSDETFFDGDPVNIHDLYNEKSGIFDDEDDSEVDLASYAYQIWKNATDNDPALLKIVPDLPNVVYATKGNTFVKDKEGVIVYTRTADDNDVLAWMSTQGKMITQSQLAILKAAECSKNTEPRFKIPDHHQIVKNAVDVITKEDVATGSSLGKKTGVKYRVYMRLDRYLKENEGTLFVTNEMKKAVDDIFKYPLKEFARDTLNRQLKAGISDETLASLVVSLRDDDKLCITDGEAVTARLPQIICSMGIRNIE
ncbi:MAG: NgoFVII family restriction endonuclease [Desulfatiglans sp.]|jgi:superfamily II DNA or RNA helicase|nr:NgoFVII family restriction endonuclease [Desulfatiglans sp.]